MPAGQRKYYYQKMHGVAASRLSARSSQHICFIMARSAAGHYLSSRHFSACHHYVNGELGLPAAADEISRHSSFSGRRDVAALYRSMISFPRQRGFAFCIVSGRHRLRYLPRCRLQYPGRWTLPKSPPAVDHGIHDGKTSLYVSGRLLLIFAQGSHYAMPPPLRCDSQSAYYEAWRALSIFP